MTAKILRQSQPATPIDTDTFRSVMGTLCQQVTVIGTRTADGQLHGTTVTAFCSLSLRPPMVSVALDRESRLLGHLVNVRRLSVSLLSHDQDSVAKLFATRSDDKNSSASWTIGPGDLPYVDGASAWLTCDVVEFVQDGDHNVLFCVVTHASHSGELRPLVYSHRMFGTNSAVMKDKGPAGE
ncbi:flavin reductase family protein [Pseudonocardia sp. Cha107L01]|uniref:flavin reductase family protein n=1 Tax=Pseudonocardia sp. Cha107L01 TaxID=3457576 RepID=UPI00403E42C8